ncbi:hypothetical protein L6452_00306 [Arctium lappa]|uniref:Uncharacterized protein n=1 Tax=Arctium lappa TaxID=4217 RepID=A0ACB9FDY7_ARCLA|nr:hypothetical protein L6452_00306 [Arctium lappa]
MTSKDALSIGTDVKPPVLFKGEYEQWKDRFLDFIDRHSNGENIFLSITEGPMKPIIIHVPADDVYGDDVDGDSDDGDVEKEIKTKPVKVDFSQYSEEQKSSWDFRVTGQSAYGSIGLVECELTDLGFQVPENRTICYEHSLQIQNYEDNVHKSVPHHNKHIALRVLLE